MKSLLFRIAKNSEESLLVQFDNVINSFSSRHYHPELQITLVKSGHGTCFIGDSIEQYIMGDIFIIGPNLPHVFRPTKSLIEGTYSDEAHLISIYFNKNVFGETFYHLPELKNIRTLIEYSVRGIKISSQYLSKMSGNIIQIADSYGFERILELFSFLNIVANSNDWTFISSMSFLSPQKEADNETINSIFEYLMKNYDKEIQLQNVAEIAHMTPTSFCRYFKSRTRNTFTEFLMKIRIGHASRLLIEKETSISEIAYECGFNNLSNFNRQFKRISGSTPGEYRKLNLL